MRQHSRKRIAIGVVLLAATLAIWGSLINAKLQRRLQSYRDADIPVSMRELDQWYEHPQSPDQDAIPYFEKATERLANHDTFPIVQSSFEPGYEPRTGPIPLGPELERQIGHLIPPIRPHLPPTEAPSPELAEAIHDFAKENREVSTLIHQGLELGPARFHVDLTEDYSVIASRIVRRSKSIMTFLMIESLNYTIQNDAPNALQSHIDALRYARRFMDCPNAFSYAVGRAGMGIGINYLWYRIQRAPLSQGDIDAYHSTLDDLESSVSPIQPLIANRAVAIDLLTGSPRRFLALLRYYNNKPPVERFKSLSIQILRRATGHKNLYKALDYFDALEALSNVPYPERVDRALAIESEVETWKGIDPALEPVYRYGLQPIARFYKQAQSLARIRVAKTLIEVEEARLRNDVSDGPIPTDFQPNAIDPYSSDPLIYRSADQGYAVYSLGPNRQDDTEDSLDKALEIQGDDIGFTIRHR